MSNCRRDVLLMVDISAAHECDRSVSLSLLFQAYVGYGHSKVIDRPEHILPLAAMSSLRPTRYRKQPA